jgi:hypothetical protein
MATLSRNAPCACGSGKKVKHCCGARDKVVALAPGAAAHRMDERLVDRMVAFANERLGRDWLVEPMRAYFLLRPFEREDLQLFMPWVMNHWRVDGRPMREWFLAERADTLPEAEHDWLLSQAGAVLSVWEARQVYEGEGLMVKDLLRGEERFVHEVKGSRTVKFREALLGRVVDHEGLSVFCGVFPRTLPPREADLIVRAVRGELKVRGQWVPHEKLAAEGVDLGLIHLWMEAVLELDTTTVLPPRLVNMEGDPLLLTADHFSFSPHKRPEVLERLRKLEGAQLGDEGPPTDLFFLKPGGDVPKAFEAISDGIYVGRAVVEQSRLHLETNSVKRADLLRARVEEACEGLLKHRAREHTDPQVLLAAGDNEVDNEAEYAESEPAAPEMLQALREFKARHYTGWLDVPLPSLKGKTPREAVRTPAGRRRVELLLKELEHGEALLPEPERTDLTPLRGELGLTD